jgi:hypothetical protein
MAGDRSNQTLTRLSYVYKLKLKFIYRKMSFLSADGRLEDENEGRRESRTSFESEVSIRLGLHSRNENMNDKFYTMVSHYRGKRYFRRFRAPRQHGKPISSKVMAGRIHASTQVYIFLWNISET